MDVQNTASYKWTGPRALFAALGLMTVVRLALAFLRFPPEFAAPLGLLVTVFFLAFPVVALFYAGDWNWKPRFALWMLVVGALIHVGLVALAQAVKLGPVIEAFTSSIAMAGMLTWCAGLGALLASLMKDRNLLLPVAAFLMGLDVFLVTYPFSTTRQVLDKAPQAFKHAAYSLPKAVSTVSDNRVGVEAAAYVGPADFFFLFMFFVCLYKYNLRLKPTMNAVAIALVLYLFVVLFLGDRSLGPVPLAQLPALVPIGGAFLLVNIREFKLKPDEWVMTGIVAAIGIALGWLGVSEAGKQQARRAATSPSGSGQGVQAPPSSPAPKP